MSITSWIGARQRTALRRVIVGLAAFVLQAIMLTAQTSQVANPQSLPAAPQPAQIQAVHLKDYSVPVSSFPHVIQPYKARKLEQPIFSNSPRIDTLIRDGKIYLSIDDAVALTLENNLDLDIARYNLNIAETDMLRAKSGANILGVNTGVVQNTPGGGIGGLGATVGSGTGGTNIAAGGAGTGTLGLVSSTLGLGSTITSFDPIITATLQSDHASSLSTSPFAPVPVLQQNTDTANFSYIQGFKWGTNLSVGFNNTHLTTNSTTSLLTPQLNSAFQLRLTQDLLQGFGFLPNTRFIRIAKNNREISDVAFRLQIIMTVDQIENIYWDLVFAYENVRVQQEALSYAQRALQDTRQQVQFGTAPPIQVVSAQSTVATGQQNVILAENNLQLQQLLMKNALSRTIEDPILAEAEVIPTSTIDVPAQEPVTPIQDLVSDALSHRAELVETRIDLNSRAISNKAVRNAMLPTLNAFAYYGGAGLGGDVNPNCQFGGVPCFNPAKAPPPFRDGGPVSYGETLNQLVNSTAPDKGIGLTLTIPIRNRLAQANQVRSELEYRQAEVRQRQLENQVRIEVRNAQFDVRQNRAAVQAAQSAVDLAKQTLDADQQKLRVGVTTQTAILQDVATVTAAESNLVSAKAAYAKSRIELDRATGLLLEHAGIDVNDAERGQVNHMPTVPFTVPRPPDQPIPATAPEPPPK